MDSHLAIYTTLRLSVFHVCVLLCVKPGANACARERWPLVL
jgi:hypothetical protein